MTVLALILSVIASIIAIAAYQKAGGIADLQKQVEALSKIGDSIVKATDSLRTKTADVLDKMEAALRAKETKGEKKKKEGQ